MDDPSMDHHYFDRRRRDNLADPLACLFTSILMQRMSDPLFTPNFDPRMGGLSSTSIWLDFQHGEDDPSSNPPFHIDFRYKEEHRM
jgi:hypothetical protein